MSAGRTSGFTLVELMIVIALLAIIAFIAVPNFTNLIRDNRIQSQAEELNSLLQYARSEAVIRKVSTTVTINTDSGQVTVVSPREPTEPLRVATLTIDGIEFGTSASDGVIGYRPNGTATLPGFSAIFCRDGDTSSGLLLTVSGSGSTTLHAKGRKADGTSLGSCTL